MKRVLAYGAAALAGASFAFAQDTPPPPPPPPEKIDPERPPGQTPEEPVSRDDVDLVRIFGGPKVGERVTSASLVERDAAGALVRLEVVPEEAALALVELDEESRARVDAVIAERASRWNRVVRDEIGLLLEIRAAVGAGDREGAAALLRQLSERAPGLFNDRAYANRLLDAAPPDVVPVVRALAREYRTAVMGELRRRAAAGEGEVEALGMRERVEALGRELRRAYERTFAFDRADLEEMLGMLGLRPEVDAAVRNAVVNFAQKNALGEASAADRDALVRELRRMLTAGQWRALIEWRFGRGEGAGDGYMDAGG